MKKGDSNGVQWNKVTTFSKCVALILFFAIPIFAFWFGVEYGMILSAAYSTPVFMVSPGGSEDASYYSNVSTWQIDQDTSAGFSIKYPIDFSTQETDSLTPTANWRVDSNNTPGIENFTLTVPSAFQPQTNFADATLTVGHSANAAAVANCLTPDATGGPATSSTQQSINGTQFTVFYSGDVGAGNIYQTTSYRTIHNGQCYAVEYTIHSSQIANYPSQYNLQPFSEGQVNSVLENIVGSFTFL